MGQSASRKVLRRFRTRRATNKSQEDFIAVSEEAAADSRNHSLGERREALHCPLQPASDVVVSGSYGHNINRHRSKSVIAKIFDFDLPAGARKAYMGAQLCGAHDRLAVDAHNHVAVSQAGLRRGRARCDRGDHGARRRLRLQGNWYSGRMVLDRDAELSARDFAKTD